MHERLRVVILSGLVEVKFLPKKKKKSDANTQASFKLAVYGGSGVGAGLRVSAWAAPGTTVQSGYRFTIGVGQLGRRC